MSPALVLHYSTLNAATHIPLSWINALKGAIPVPGPIIMIGTSPSDGSLKSGLWLMKTGHVSPTATLSWRKVVHTPVRGQSCKWYRMTAAHTATESCGGDVGREAGCRWTEVWGNMLIYNGLASFPGSPQRSNSSLIMATIGLVLIAML